MHIFISADMLLVGCFFFVLISHFQVDVLCGYKETESLVEELMKMKIPDYKPSCNHVHLSDKGISNFVSQVPGLTIFLEPLIINHTLILLHHLHIFSC